MLYLRWEHRTTDPEGASVLPDGCRDIIVAARDDAPAEVLYTGWDSAPRNVELAAGTSLTGYRLSPGSILSPAALAALQAEEAPVAEILGSELRRDPDLSEAIGALGRPAATVAGIARQSGVTLRTFQRRFAGLSLPSPDFWRQLGRARRAAQALPGALPLIEIAFAFDYSDQAHMTRDFVRWFGQSPARLRANPSRLEQILAPGLGNWPEPAGL